MYIYKYIYITMYIYIAPICINTHIHVNFFSVLQHEVQCSTIVRSILIYKDLLAFILRTISSTYLFQIMYINKYIFYFLLTKAHSYRLQEARDK